MYDSLELRFWLKVRIEISGCWEWHGKKNRNGYGIFHVEYRGGSSSRSMLAHRASYLIHYGYLPEDKVVMHMCDNRACVRPDHLQLGTQAENCADMQRKGRARGAPQRIFTCPQCGGPITEYGNPTQYGTYRRRCTPCGRREVRERMRKLRA